MHAHDETPAVPSDDPLDLLRHDLKSPLTTIGGRAQLLARMVLRSAGLTELERGAMLDGLATIEAAVRTMAVVIDRMEPGVTDQNEP